MRIQSVISTINYGGRAFYKYFLGGILSLGLHLNYFDYPPYRAWPPPTPARKYINDFLDMYLDEVKGRCVEFDPQIYRNKYINNPKIVSYDIWNTEPRDGATLIGDLQYCPHIPDGSFDTIICTHVLCCVPKPWEATEEIHRILAPGGVILCTNPVVLSKYEPHPYDCWRFTKDSMKLLFSKFSDVKIHSFGNAAMVAASPFYLMTNHFPNSVIDYNDPECPSIVAAAAWK